MSDEETTSREDAVQKIADAELRKLIDQGCRMCTIAPKFVDPRMQCDTDADTVTAFSDTCRAHTKMEQNGMWGPCENARNAAEDDAEEMSLTVETFVREWERLDEIYLRLPVKPVEDGVTTAVREALELCELTGGYV